VAGPRVVRCPQCGAPVEWTAASAFRPFCSERCRNVDLGAWASEAYRVPIAEFPEADDLAAAVDDDETGPAGESRVGRRRR
jgi:endogenous inhibitor of DNA gyrase (YacG/DUF329 family)